MLNSLTPGRFQWNFVWIIFKLISVIDGRDITYEIVLRWISLDLSDDKSTLVQEMAWCCQATSHYLSQCWPRSLLPYGVIKPQWVNSLWPSGAIWWHRSGSILAQEMACFLTAPSHDLIQCYVIISKVPWPSSEGNFISNTWGISH